MRRAIAIDFLEQLVRLQAKWEWCGSLNRACGQYAFTHTSNARRAIFVEPLIRLSFSISSKPFPTKLEQLILYNIVLPLLAPYQLHPFSSPARTQTKTNTKRRASVSPTHKIRVPNEFCVCVCVLANCVYHISVECNAISDCFQLHQQQQPITIRAQANTNRDSAKISSSLCAQRCCAGFSVDEIDGDCCQPFRARIFLLSSLSSSSSLLPLSSDDLLLLLYILSIYQDFRHSDVKMSVFYCSASKSDGIFIVRSCSGRSVGGGGAQGERFFLFPCQKFSSWTCFPAAHSHTQAPGRNCEGTSYGFGQDKLNKSLGRGENGLKASLALPSKFSCGTIDLVRRPWQRIFWTVFLEEHFGWLPWAQKMARRPFWDQQWWTSLTLPFIFNGKQIRRTNNKTRERVK